MVLMRGSSPKFEHRFCFWSSCQGRAAFVSSRRTTGSVPTSSVCLTRPDPWGRLSCWGKCQEIQWLAVWVTKRIPVICGRKSSHSHSVQQGVLPSWCLQGLCFHWISYMLLKNKEIFKILIVFPLPKGSLSVLHAQTLLKCSHCWGGEQQPAGTCRWQQSTSCQRLCGKALWLLQACDISSTPENKQEQCFQWLCCKILIALTGAFMAFLTCKDKRHIKLAGKPATGARHRSIQTCASLIK